MQILLCAIILLTACSGDGEQEPVVTPPGTVEPNAQLQLVVSGLSSPVHLTAPAGDARLFVVEQPGRIRIVQNGQLVATPFLDISAKLRSGGEQGLLGLAFHPQYATNGFFFVNYTDTQGHTRIERYRVSSDPNRADAASAKQILFISQPYSNHNGGHLLFGPDGMLYIPTGDGGSGGDPQNHAQTRADLLGDLLRINVNSGDPYEIPSDNPYYGQSASRNEIWAYGLRNPWRIAFDRTDNMLYIADVGQNNLEEVNVVPSSQKGVNYGWRLMEGDRCYNPSSNCNQSGLTLPVLTYDHSGQACSITGGHVYRGNQVASIRGHYFYGDYCAGWIRSFKYVNGQATERREWPFGSIGGILSFGEDGSGELYVLTASGRVYKFVP